MLSQNAAQRSRIPPPPPAPLQAVPLSPRVGAPRTGTAPIAVDPAMRRVVAHAERLAATDLAVLVHGESGSGKEVLVQHMHAIGARSGAPLVAENCSAIPESLAESLLFGHVRGAFTGADRDRAGLFEQADGGTLFLDEIGDMSLALQARLLRVLEERRVRPVGGDRSIAFDVRIVCATHQDLAALVEAGKFRADLYFRLAGATITVPPLRERPDDVEALALRFLAELDAQNGTCRRFAAGLVARMRAHAWPGNVRELKNRVTALYHLCDGETIDGALPTSDVRVERAERPATEGRLVTRVAKLAEIEKAAIELALQESGGDRRETARMLGISRSTLYVRIRDLGLQAKPGTDDAPSAAR